MYITEQIKNTTNKINESKQISTRNINQINMFRKELIDKVNMRMDELIQKSNYEIDKKQNILSQYVQELEQKSNALNKSLSETDNVFKDTTINTKIRKNKIIKISNDALNTKINDPNITPEVTINFENNQFLSL